MNNQTLSLQARTITGKAVKRLLDEGVLPCVAYGKGIASVTAQVSYREFEKVYRTTGSSTLVNLTMPDGTSKKALISEVAKDPITDTYAHADLYIVDMTQKMTANVPLNFVGESKAVKELGANLTKTLQELEIECLPADLPSHIDVPLDSLVNIGDMIRVSSLTIPSGVTVKDNPDVVVATVELIKEEKEDVLAATAEQEKAAIEKLQTEQQEKKVAKEGEEKEETKK